MGPFIIFIYYIYLIFFSFWLGLWIFACHAAEHVKQEPSIAWVLKAETEKKKKKNTGEVNRYLHCDSHNAK